MALVSKARALNDIPHPPIYSTKRETLLHLNVFLDLLCCSNMF
jgi:hypothetical protein